MGFYPGSPVVITMEMDPVMERQCIMPFLIGDFEHSMPQRPGNRLDYKLSVRLMIDFL